MLSKTVSNMEIGLFSIVLLCLAVFTIDCSGVFAPAVDSDTYFIIDNYNTYINFDSTQTFNDIEAMATYLMLDNYYLIAENGNITFSSWVTASSLRFETSWSSDGTTTLWINGSSPIKTPYKITYTASPIGWYWFGENSTLKLDVPNPNIVEIFWVQTGSVDDEPSPPGQVIVIPSPEIVPVDFVSVVTPFVPSFGQVYPVLLFFGVVAAVYFVGSKLKRKSVKDAFRKRVVTFGNVNLRKKKDKRPKIKRGDPYE